MSKQITISEGIILDSDERLYIRGLAKSVTIEFENNYILEELRVYIGKKAKLILEVQE